MAKDISFKLKFESNGKTVMGDLTMSANSLKDAVNAVQKITSSSVSGLTNYAASLTVMMQGLCSSLSQLAEPAMSFDKAMRAANTMAGKGAEDFDKLKDAVKGLSKEVPIARDVLATGLYQVISNGVPEDNWIEYLHASARSAVGGMADLEEVVKVTSTVIKNYGLSWDDAVAVQDKIQLTARNGVTSFEQLAQALPRVTGNAATLGVSIDELMATFSTLTGVSGNTAEVSTQLAAVFTALVKPSKQAQEMARAMGIEFNAASIRAAGGLGNFLSSLDSAVNQYAAANRVLADEVYARLFGSAESLRALGPLTGQLADKYRENVAAMADSAGTMDTAFETMAGSAESAGQRIKNMWIGVTDILGGFVAKGLPAVQFISSASVSMGALVAVVKTLSTVFTKCAGSVNIATIATKAWALAGKAANALLSIMPRRVKLCAVSMEMFAATSRRTAIAVNVLKVAIKGLISVTVIGAAVMAVITIIDKLTNRVDKAGDAAAEAAREFKEWKKSLTDVSGLASQTAAQEMSALERLYRTATDETKSREERNRAAKELQRTYKDTFQNLSTEAIMAGKAAQAYDSLKQSILEAARAKAAESLIISNTEELLKLEDRKQTIEEEELPPAQSAADKTAKRAAELWERRNSLIGFLDRLNDPDGLSSYTDAQYDQAAKEAGAARKELEAVETELATINTKIAEIEKANDRLQSYVNSDTSTAPEGGGNLDDLLKNGKKTARQLLEERLTKAKDSYVKAALAGNDAEAASIKRVIDLLNEQLATVEMAEKQAARPATLKSLADIDAELQYQQALRSRATADNIAGIDATIKALKKQRQAIEEVSVQVKGADTIETYEELEAALSHYHTRMQTATADERREIQRTINALDRLREKWDDALGELKAPGDIATLDTVRKLNDAISYYENRRERAAATEVAGIQATINALKHRRELLERGVTIADMGAEVGGINALHGGDYRIKVEGVGFENLTEKIRQLRAMLNDTDNPLSDGLKQQARELIAQYEVMRARSLESYDGMKRVWGNTKQLADGITGITQAVRGDGNAWEKTTAIIDGAMQAYESITQTIQVISAIMAMFSAIKRADTTATEENTAATVAGAIADVTASQAEATAATVNANAQVAAAAGKTMAAHAAIPFVGIALGAAMVASMIAVMASLPKFADGGIAYGPTVGMFGEYAGASNNPEVVAPLDRLRSLIQPQGFDAGKVEFEIDGYKLHGFLRRIDSRISRS